MAMRSRVRVCSSPDCGDLAPRGGLCPACRRVAQRELDRGRPSAARRGYDVRWRATRARFLRDHLFCEHEAGCANLAVDVHHVDGEGPLGPRGHDPTNLRALCKSHHSAITAREGFAR